MMLNNKHFLTASLLSMGLVLTGCATNNNAHGSQYDKSSMSKTHYHGHGKSDKAIKNPHHDMKDHKNMDMMAHHHFDKLALSDTQKKQLEALTAQNKTKIEQLHASLAEQEKNIKKQTEAKADTATLLKLYQQKQATVEEMSELHKASQKQFFAILPPEQQLQMFEGHKKVQLMKNHPHMDKHHHAVIETKKPERPIPPPDLPPASHY